jgi:hypothetical protein
MKITRDGYTAEWHAGGRHGAWISVKGPGIDGQLELPTRADVAGRDQLHDACRFAKRQNEGR